MNNLTVNYSTLARRGLSVLDSNFGARGYLVEKLVEVLHPLLKKLGVGV